MTKPRHPQIGGLVEDWLKEEGIYEEATTAAIKRVLAWQLEQAMKEGKLTKTAMAKRRETSRPQLDRLCSIPRTATLTLDTLTKAAAAVGRKVRVELV